MYCAMRVDGAAVALHHVEGAVGQARFPQQLRHEQRRRGVALARFQHEGVAARERHREHPARHHDREVERRDAGHDAERLAQRPVVDAGAHLVGEVALQQLRRAARELDDVDAAGDLALGIGEDLAVLRRDHGRQPVAVPVHELEEGVQHPRPPDGRRVGPGGKRGAGRGDRALHFFRRGEADLPHHRARGRVVHRLGAARAGDGAAADEVADGRRVVVVGCRGGVLDSGGHGAFLQWAWRQCRCATARRSVLE
jgi:hypothetical protein